MRRKVVVATAENGDTGDKLDQLLLSSAICNGEDLSPFIRKAFASGKPETLLHHLRHFGRSKESEIEEVCKVHYQDFIMAVDDLRSLLSGVESLKSSISNSNYQLQSVAGPLLTSLDSFIEARNKCQNITLAIESLRICVRLMELCSRVNFHLSKNNFYMALKCIDSIERDFIHKTSSSTLRRMLEKKIPAIRAHIERRISKEFGDWLVEIRTVSRNLGQVAIGQASAGRQREEELRIRQRQAEEQSRLSLRDAVYALEEEDDDGYFTGNEGNDFYGNGGNANSTLGFDLTPLYRSYHIHQTLGLEDGFKKYYFENRKLQLTSDFQVSSMTPFLESHQTFFAQIAGFFIVEDRVLRTGGGLITKMEVENLWDTAVSKMCSVLEDQFSRMRTANHLLLIKDYVSLLGVTLRRYGYSVDALLDVLNKHRDKYHELLLSDCQKQIAEALAADKFEQMWMNKEYEYSMNVLSFQIQTSDIVPAFPYIAPFSSTVPDCCRIVRSFIEDSVSFMSHGGQLDFFDVVKKYLDRLLTEVLDDGLLKLISTSISGVNQAMVVAANMAVLERACDFFFRHAAKLSGVPLRVQILPGQVLKRVLQDVLSHISETIVNFLVGESVKRFSLNAVMGIDVDIKLLESFAENQAPLVSEEEAIQLKKALVEARQLVNLLLSNNPENFLNPVIRERSYNALDYKKVAIISEKLKDPSERLFGTFGSRGYKQNPKKKSLDSLIKRLKDVN
ncbi:Exocyst complex subunit Sec15-like protein [Cynara cardunculus var. scolymus]|uniref:Exocyst complex component n=1 Tax=Cynara cardunculus var. scolymus TaxID=59895 RepID=A0A103YNR1_CYNCS|nr:Exocyst complex subunit Sec15-like protein [Cynara cardunculus var. scolymus]